MNDFLDAACRHYESALLLYQARNRASASHLFGIAGECVLKALIFQLQPQNNIPQHLRKHLGSDLWINFAGHPSMSMFPQRITAAQQFKTGFSDWDVSQRYVHRKVSPPVFSAKILQSQRKSAKGLMATLDLIQRGLL